MGRLSILKAKQHIDDFVDGFAGGINNVKADSKNGSRAVYERKLYVASVFLRRIIKNNLDEEYSKLADNYFIALLDSKGVLVEYQRIMDQYILYILSLNKKSDSKASPISDRFYTKSTKIKVPAAKGDKTEVLAIDPDERLEDASIMARIVQNGEGVYL